MKRKKASLLVAVVQLDGSQMWTEGNDKVSLVFVRHACIVFHSFASSDDTKQLRIASDAINVIKHKEEEAVSANNKLYESKRHTCRQSTHEQTASREVGLKEL